MQKILIVEDDKSLREELEIFLNKNGYQAILLEKFEHPVETILNLQPHLVLLDINLPIVEGEYILKEIRKVSDIPIIMLTSRISEIDELLSMNYGADDYITKPFNIQILLAKINAILKRVGKVENLNKINCQDFILNISKSTIEKGNKIVDLTKNELKILHYLVQRRGKIITREEIMEYLWDSASFIDDNTLTVNITRLRNKLEELQLKDLIETKRGQGYMLK